MHQISFHTIKALILLKQRWLAIMNKNDIFYICSLFESVSQATGLKKYNC